MKIQKVAALLLSMALTFSTCMPLNGIAALGAETGNTGVEASEQEEISDSAESTEIQQEEDLSSKTEDVETTAPEEDTSLAEENHPEQLCLRCRGRLGYPRLHCQPRRIGSGVPDRSSESDLF